MRDLEEIEKEAMILLDQIENFCFNAGMTESRIALNLWYLKRSMQALVDQIGEIVEDNIGQ